MSRRVLAMAGLTVRSAIRSRIVWLLLCMLGLIVVATPAALQGDGTVRGQVQIQIAYAMGLAVAVLSASAVWTSCAAFAQDIADRHIHLVAAKPVAGWEMWLGKWIGLAALHAALLAAAGVAVYGVVRWRLPAAYPSAEDQRILAEEILVARSRVSPTTPGASPVRPDGSDGPLQRFYAAGPGESIQWTFRLPAAPPPDRPLHLRFRFASSTWSADAISTEWTLGGAGSPQVVHRRLRHPPHIPATLRAPPETVAPDGALHVRLSPPPHPPATLFFAPDDGLVLWVYTGSFEANGARALAVLLCRLGLLIAVGLTAGALCSLPVAALLSLTVVLLLQAAPYIGNLAMHSATEAGGPPLLDAWIHIVARTLHIVLAPLDAPPPLDALSQGRLVPWARVGTAVLFDVLAYGGGVALFGCWRLRHRELGDAA